MLCSYQYMGASWGFEIIAEGSNHDDFFEDAKGRLAAIHFNGKVDGIKTYTIPVSPSAGLFVRAIVFLRNFLF